MNFAKFLKTPFSQNTSGRLLLDALGTQLGHCYWPRVYIEVSAYQKSQKPTPKRLNKSTVGNCDPSSKFSFHLMITKSDFLPKGSVALIVQFSEF